MLDVPLPRNVRKLDRWTGKSTLRGEARSIVDGKECVGFDCIEGEVFGFCTEILKENNTRFFFNDTSTSAMFPKNDWEIVANDTNDGGASYFGIADRGSGLVNFCGEGTCEGGDNAGASCGVGGCEGVCVDAGFPGIPCLADAQCDLSGFPGGSVGTCEGAGVCVPSGAIIFRIEAGGPEDSLVIDDAGDVNIPGNLYVGGTISGTSGGVAQLCPVKEVMIGIDADGTIILCQAEGPGRMKQRAGFARRPPVSGPLVKPDRRG